MIDFSYQLIKMMAQCSGAKVPDLNPYDKPSSDTINAAIKYMVEKSLFFPRDIVLQRHEEMRQGLMNHELPVRFSRTMRDIKQDAEGNYYLERDGVKLILDKDGNRSVRGIIKDKTGHIVSQGQANTIKFANISHVWGQAYNPYFFSSLWNIVLIPSYCNPLMDKLSGDVAITIQNVFREICKEIYQAEEKLEQLSGQEKLEQTGIIVSHVDKNNRDLAVTIYGKTIPIVINYLENASVGSLLTKDPEVQASINDESYEESDIEAYKLLSEIKEGTKNSYYSYLKGVSDVLKKKDMSDYAGKSPKTIINWRSAVEFAKKLFAKESK